MGEITGIELKKHDILTLVKTRHFYFGLTKNTKEIDNNLLASLY